MPRKLLLLSYSFPPHAAPEAFLSAKTLGGMQDYEIHALAAEPASLGLPKDSSLERYVRERFRRVIRVEAPGWLARASRSKAGTKLLAAASQFPDRLVFLGARTARVAESLELDSYDAMVSWSQYHSSHLAALRIKRRHPRLRWLAHFSDPWADNPFNYAQAITRPLNRLLEARVIRGAESLIFTSELTVDLVLRNYPASLRRKACVIPHPFEPALYPPAPPKRSGPKVLRYLGNFYGPRNPQTFLQAIARLKEQDPRLAARARFEFIGPATHWSAQARKLGLGEEIARFNGSVSYVQSLELMSAADALLVIDAPAESSVFLPSKLVDYLGAGKPILGVTPPGTSADLIREIGGRVADPADVGAIAEALRLALRDLESPKPLPEAVLRRYHVDTIAKKMRELIEPQR